MAESTDHLIGIAVGAVALLGALAAWLRWVRPKIRNGRQEVVAVRDAILGRDAIRDSITGKEIEPALPGMGVRMAHQEHQSREQQAQMQILTDAVAKIADSHTRLDGIESRVKVLEEASVERVVTRAESAQAWRAIAAAHGDSDEPERPDLP